MEKKKSSTTNANLTIRVSVRPNFHKELMQRKHGLLVKVMIMKIIHQILMVLVGGRAEDVAERKRIVAASSDFRLFGKNACDFLSCDDHLISGVTIRLSLRRFPNGFVIMYENRDDKHYRVEITEANLI